MIDPSRPSPSSPPWASSAWPSSTPAPRSRGRQRGLRARFGALPCTRTPATRGRVPAQTERVEGGGASKVAGLTLDPLALGEARPPADGHACLPGTSTRRTCASRSTSSPTTAPPADKLAVARQRAGAAHPCPSTIGEELLVNPFLRCDEPVVAARFPGASVADRVFAAVRSARTRSGRRPCSGRAYATTPAACRGERLHQLGLDHLPHRVAGHRLHDETTSRWICTARSAPAPQERIRRTPPARPAGHRHHHRHHPVAPRLVRQPHHRHLGDRRVLAERLLDLEGRQLVAAALQDVDAGPTEEPDVACRAPARRRRRS